MEAPKQSAEVIDLAAERDARQEAAIEQAITEAKAFQEAMNDILDRNDGEIKSADDATAFESFGVALAERLANIPPADRIAKGLPTWHPMEATWNAQPANDSEAPSAVSVEEAA